MGTWPGSSVNELLSPALLIMTVQMVEPMRTNILAMKAVRVDEKGSKVVLRKTSADKPSPNQPGRDRTDVNMDMPEKMVPSNSME